MMKLEFWRRRPRQFADGASAVGGGVAATATLRETAESAVALAALQQAVERTLGSTLDRALDEAAEGEHQLLRRAAQQQHADTVPAAFYRAPAD